MAAAVAPRDLTSQLEERGQYPPSWLPETEGAIVQGTLFKYTRAPTRYGDCWVAWLKTKEGPVCVWISSAVLAAEFKRLKPKVGEYVGVRFVGWSADRRYKKFAVAVADRPEEQPDFDTWEDPDPDSGAPGDRPRAFGAPAYAAATVTGSADPFAFEEVGR